MCFSGYQRLVYGRSSDLVVTSQRASRSARNSGGGHGKEGKEKNNAWWASKANRRIFCGSTGVNMEGVAGQDQSCQVGGPWENSTQVSALLLALSLCCHPPLSADMVSLSAPTLPLLWLIDTEVCLHRLHLPAPDIMLAEVQMVQPPLHPPAPPCTALHRPAPPLHLPAPPCTALHRP